MNIHQHARAQNTHEIRTQGVSVRGRRGAGGARGVACRCRSRERHCWERRWERSRPGLSGNVTAAVGCVLEERGGRGEAMASEVGAKALGRAGRASPPGRAGAHGSAVRQA